MSGTCVRESVVLVCVCVYVCVCVCVNACVCTSTTCDRGYALRIGSTDLPEPPNNAQMVSRFVLAGMAKTISCAMALNEASTRLACQVVTSVRMAVGACVLCAIRWTRSHVGMLIVYFLCMYQCNRVNNGCQYLVENGDSIGEKRPPYATCYASYH